MSRSIDRTNRRADKLNPTMSGIRTGNPQLATRATKRKAAKPRHAKLSVRVKRGERKGA
jgi:hypothetical protein